MTKAPLSYILAGLAIFATSALAQMQDIEISAARQITSEEESKDNGAKIKTKEIVYKITARNTFKAIPELCIKYAIFYEDTKSKTASADKAHTGQQMISNLEANSSSSFDTKPLTFTMRARGGNWIYEDGSLARSKDIISGIWIRAYAGDKLVGEYANPSTVSKKNQWKD